MSLSSFVSFQSRFVTYLLTFPRRLLESQRGTLNRALEEHVELVIVSWHHVLMNVWLTMLMNIWLMTELPNFT